MAKDIIFKNEPPVKYPVVISSRLTNPARLKMYFKGEIDFNEWYELDLYEKLERGDIFEYDDFRYAETNIVGCGQTGLNKYYRKKTPVSDFKKKGTLLTSDRDEYQILSPNTILEKDDQFYHDESMKWFVTGKIGTPVGGHMIYRRKIGKQQLFTDEELNKARTHYKIRNIPVL